MNSAETFQQFLTTQNAEIQLSNLLVALILAAIISIIIGKAYIKYGSSFSNRKRFASNFMLITMTTTLIITIVKSSLALSLGLVGALSIVRFRAAIKEPEELAYLFLCIVIGLGLGANQILITAAAFVLILAVIMIKGTRYKKEMNNNVCLIVSSKQGNLVNLDNIVHVLKEYCGSVWLKRFDETDKILEASFLIDINSFERLDQIKKRLKMLSDSIRISYLDNKGMLG